MLCAFYQHRHADEYRHLTWLCLWSSKSVADLACEVLKQVQHDCTRPLKRPRFNVKRS
jgi:hypothetical protein